MIPLYVETNGTAYVWNSEDWYTLRSQFRICGALIGSIPSFPRQNDFLGLPMALKSEETALLVEKGICNLFELPNIRSPPTAEHKQFIKELENNAITEQTEALRKRKIEQLSQKIDIIIAGKRQKLLSKGITDIILDKQTLLQEKVNKLPKLAAGHVLTHLPTEHNWPTGLTDNRVARPISESIWNQPSTSRQALPGLTDNRDSRPISEPSTSRQVLPDKKEVSINVLRPSVVEGEGAIRYKIFKNLWEQQYHMTSGSKFGCDYLVYPGDPVRFHATYMVRCVYNQAAALSPAEFVAFGRLSVSVNKLAVFAFINSSGQVDFQTLQWHDNVM